MEIDFQKKKKKLPKPTKKIPLGPLVLAPKYEAGKQAPLVSLIFGPCAAIGGYR